MCGLALRVDNLILSIIGNRMGPVYFREKHFGEKQALLCVS